MMAANVAQVAFTQVSVRICEVDSVIIPIPIVDRRAASRELDSSLICLVPWLCQDTSCLRLCRLMAEAEPPEFVPTQSMGTSV
jgi:hypothetical protein